MSNSMQHPGTTNTGGAVTITLPTSHPTWCDVDSHQGMRNDLIDDGLGLDPARKHWASEASNFLAELRWGHDVVRDQGGHWDLTLEQIPREDDETAGDTGWPFIVLYTGEPGLGQACGLNLTSGEARVLAAQLVAAADKIDLS